MSLANKLQLKPGWRVAVLGRPARVDLGGDLGDGGDGGDSAGADAVVLFVTTAGDLSGIDADRVVTAGRRDAGAWVAYPKAGQLGTDLNRDSLAALLAQRGLRPVRQVAIDAVWSALRFRPAG